MQYYIYSRNGIAAEGGLRATLPEPLREQDKATRIAAGWYDYVSTSPTPTEGETVVCVVYTRLGDDFTGVYKVVRGSADEEIRYSVRSIIRELRYAGKYDAVRQLLESARLDWDFIGANYLSTADADFQAMCEAIISAEIATEQELDELLAKCIWEEA
jgi:hypothetical protein